MLFYQTTENTQLLESTDAFEAQPLPRPTMACTCLGKGADPGEHHDDERLHPVLEKLLKYDR